MKNKIWMLLFILLGLCLVTTSSCKKDSTEETPTMSDESFYKDIAFALVSCYVDIYNQNLAGVATGTQNITADGPNGGTVIITGTDAYDSTHDITTADLLFSMTDVRYITSNANIVITGSTTFSGSFSSDYTSVNHQSDNLRIKGMVTRNGITRDIDSSGQVSINRSATISATIFGYTVTW